MPHKPITLLLSDGKLNSRVEVRERVSLGEFFHRFQADRPPGKETNTRYTENIHIKHLLRIFGEKTPILEIPAKLQEYITRRAEDEVSQVTIKKELSTLTSIWNRWGAREQLITVPLSLRNLEYLKQKDKPPFQTWEHVLRKTKGKPDSELWNSGSWGWKKLRNYWTMSAPA